MKSILPIVCRMPNRWLLLQVCWPTTECLVFRFLPYTSILIQFASKPVIILPMIQVLPVWIDRQPGKDLKLCVTAPLFCLPARSVAQRIFEHVLPCRRTMLLFLREAVLTPVIFQLILLHPKYTCSRKWSWFVKNNVFEHVPHGSHILLLSSILYVIHVKLTEVTLVFDVQTDIPKLVLFSHSGSNSTSSNGHSQHSCQWVHHI